MAQSFLKKPGVVTGAFDENTLTLWVDTEMTKGILGKRDNAAKIEAAAAAFTGSPRRLIIRVGPPPPEPPAAPAENSTGPEKDPMDDLLALTRQFDNFTET